MSDGYSFKPFLKRGALVAAANWEVLLLQFIAETGFKLLLVVPVASAAFIVALLVGGRAVDFAALDFRQTLAVVLESLGEHPGALALYLLGTAVVLLGGSALTFLAKGGTVAVLVRADAQAPALERPPLRLALFRQAEAFAVERFSEGARRFFSRYLALGLALIVTYALLGAAYLAAVYGMYRVVAGTRLVVAWTLLAALVSGLFVLLLTVVNLLYLLAQIAIAVDDCLVIAAPSRVRALLGREFREVGALFLALLVVVGLATIASILATASLGFIGFIPIVGLAVLPLQLAAWLARGLVFQYLGQTALCAYVRLYRAGAGAPRPALVAPRAIMDARS